MSKPTTPSFASPQMSSLPIGNSPRPMNPSQRRVEHSELTYALSSNGYDPRNNLTVNTASFGKNIQSSASPAFSPRMSLAANSSASSDSPYGAPGESSRKARIQEQRPSSECLSPIYPDLTALSANYMKMLSTTPAAVEPSSPQSSTINPADLTSPLQQVRHEDQLLDDMVDAQAGDCGLYSIPSNDSSNFIDQASAMPPPPTPEYEYLTSASPYTPYTPYEDALDSPWMSEMLLTQPMIAGVDQEVLLFGGVEAPLGDKHESSSAPAPPVPDMTNWLTMESSPSTPYLQDFTPPTASAEEMKPPPPPSRRKSIPTGTRKNITPDSLLPVDAPTQPRKYVTPSATSKKDVPASFARKRSRSQYRGKAEEDEDDDEPRNGEPSSTELQLIETKRRQNTLAARKSRKRKLEYQQHLEDQVQTLTTEVNTWKHRAETLQTVMRSHGIPTPHFTD
ncbi:hypothetical protein ONZ45_g3765 [Pleurotus djamor]|nr:hypothetical protein ONZ45_g3765 [Pleurotus djamor]